MKIIQFSFCMLVLIFGSNQILARTLESTKVPDSWYQLPEDLKAGHIMSEDTTSASASASEEALGKAVDRLYTAHESAFERLPEIPNKAPSTQDHPQNWVPWHLDSIAADLGLTAQGLFGLLTLKGTPAVTAIWRKKTNAPKESGALLDSQEPKTGEIVIPTGVISEKQKLKSISEQVEPIYQAVIASGKITAPTQFKDNLIRTATNLNGLIESLDNQSNQPWWVSAFRFDFIVSASGTITPVWLSLGGEVRIRMEWRRLTRTTPIPLSRTNSFEAYQADLQRFIFSMESVMEESILNTPVSGPLQPLNFRIGLGSSVDGNFGIAKGSMAAIGHLMFSRDSSPPSTQKNRSIESQLLASNTGNSTIALIENIPTEEHIQFAKKNQIQMKTLRMGKSRQAIYQLPRDKFVKGVQKALKLSSFFANRPKKSHSKWPLSEVRAAFDLSMTGSLGLASVTGTFSTMIFYR